MFIVRLIPVIFYGIFYDRNALFVLEFPTPYSLIAKRYQEKATEIAILTLKYKFQSVSVHLISRSFLPIGSGGFFLLILFSLKCPLDKHSHKETLPWVPS